MSSPENEGNGGNNRSRDAYRNQLGARPATFVCAATLSRDRSPGRMHGYDRLGHDRINGYGNDRLRRGRFAAYPAHGVVARRRADLVFGVRAHLGFLM